MNDKQKFSFIISQIPDTISKLVFTANSLPQSNDGQTPTIHVAQVHI